MRKLFNLFAAALVVLAAVSCEKSEVLPCDAEGKVVTLTATIDNGGTKTFLRDEIGGNPVYWSEGDEIKVIQSTLGSGYNFGLDEGANTTTATFECTESQAKYFNPAQPYTALYPLSSFSTISWAPYCNISSQSEGYVANSFSPGTMPMVATVNSGTVMNFKNMFGIVKITVHGREGETLQSIDFGSNSILRGYFKYKTDYSAFSGVLVDRVNEGKTYSSNMTLNCNTSIASIDKEFLFAVPAGEQQFAIVLHTNKGSYYKSVSRDIVIEAGTIHIMPTITLTEDMSIAYNGGDKGVLLGKTVWAPVNSGDDSCPQGWRVPNNAEMEKLFNPNFGRGGTMTTGWLYYNFYRDPSYAEGLWAYGETIPMQISDGKVSNRIFLPTFPGVEYGTYLAKDGADYYVTKFNIMDNGNFTIFNSRPPVEEEQYYVRCVKE